MLTIMSLNWVFSSILTFGFLNDILSEFLTESRSSLILENCHNGNLCKNKGLTQKMRKLQVSGRLKTIILI